MFSKPTRNHITVIFEQLGAVGVVIITGLFSLVQENLSSAGGIKAVLRSLKYGVGARQGLVYLLAAAAALLLVVWLLLRWYKTCFYIDGEYLVCERKTLMKKVTRLPFSSLATVNLERSVFERIVGTAKIKIDINSAVTADQTDFTFVLPLEKAKQFEQLLLKAKDKAACETDVAEGAAQRELVCAFSKAQAVRHVLLSQPVVQLLVSAAVFVPGIAAQLETADISVVLPTALIIVAAWLFGIAVKILSSCNFRVECDEKSIYISSGLLKVKKYSFERGKINALVVRRPLLARMAGLYSAEVAVVGFGNDKEETPQISLLADGAQLQKVLAACAPEFSCTGEIQHSDKAGLLPSVLSAVFISLFAAVPLWFFRPVLSVLAVIIGAAIGVLSHKSKTLSFDENIFSYSGGVLSKKTAFFKYGDIQTVQLRTNAVCGRFGIGKISLSILSSNAMRVHTTGWFKKENFEKLRERIMQ